MDKARRIAGFGKMALKNEQPVGYAGQQVEKRPRLIEMIEQSAAKDRIEGSVIGDVPGIVAHEPKIRQRGPRLYVAACFDIQFPHIEPERLESEPGEFDAVPPLQAAQVRNPKISLVPGKSRI